MAGPVGAGGTRDLFLPGDSLGKPAASLCLRAEGTAGLLSAAGNRAGLIHTVRSVRGRSCRVARRRGDWPGGQGLGPTRQQKTGTKNSCSPEGPGERELETGVVLRGEQRERPPPSDSSRLAGSSPRSPTCTTLFLTSAPNFATEHWGGRGGRVTLPGQGAAAPTKGHGGRGLREKGPEGLSGTTPAFCSRRLGARARTGQAVHTALTLVSTMTGRGQLRQDGLHTPEPLSRSAETSAENAGGRGCGSPQRGACGGNEGAFPSPGEKRGWLPTGGSAEGSGCLRGRCHPQLKMTRKLQELLAPRGPLTECGRPWGPPQTGAPAGGPRHPHCGQGGRGPASVCGNVPGPPGHQRALFRGMPPAGGSWCAWDSLHQTPGTHR